jgi:hypothetical protein
VATVKGRQEKLEKIILTQNDFNTKKGLENGGKRWAG